MPLSWDAYHMQAAESAATKSKDKSTKVGAAIVGPDNESLLTGFNGFVKGVNDDVPERHERPEKSYWVQHAECSAIGAAAKRGVAIGGCRIYVTLFPCSACARMIVSAGLTEVVCREIDASPVNQRWADEHQRAATILSEGGVNIRFIEKESADA